MRRRDSCDATVLEVPQQINGPPQPPTPTPIPPPIFRLLYQTQHTVSNYDEMTLYFNDAIIKLSGMESNYSHPTVPRRLSYI